VCVTLLITPTPLNETLPLAECSIIFRRGYGNSILYLLAGANIFTDFSTGNVRGSLFGGLNVVTKQSNGNIDLAMYGGANILTQVGNGNIQ
jgi:RTX toxin RtxA